MKTLSASVPDGERNDPWDHPDPRIHVERNEHGFPVLKLLGASLPVNGSYLENLLAEGAIALPAGANRQVGPGFAQDALVEALESVDGDIGRLRDLRHRLSRLLRITRTLR